MATHYGTPGKISSVQMQIYEKRHIRQLIWTHKNYWEITFFSYIWERSKNKLRFRVLITIINSDIRRVNFSKLQITTK